MSATSHNDWLLSQYTEKRAQLQAVSGAITALVTDNVSSYDIDTAQMRRKVTRLNLNELRLMQRQLSDDVQDLAQKLGYTEDVISVVPDY